MRLTRKVQKILSHYNGENPGCKANLARFLMHGRLAGTGRLLIYPVDQGFEHGPRTFLANKEAFDPLYHFKLAVDAGLSAYAGPLGWLSAGADAYAGQIPLILKINSSNSLLNKSLPPDQAVTGSVDDALRLGCSAIGFTIYPGSDASLEQFEEIRALAAEARAKGLAVIIWSYARGNMSKEGETALDVIAYGAHIACLLGAHIVKVKLPSAHLEQTEAKKLYENLVMFGTLEARVRHVVQSCFDGRRIVIFSGGEAKDLGDVYKDAQAIADGGGNGFIMGRNCFQRPRDQAMEMLDNVIQIFKK